MLQAKLAEKLHLTPITTRQAVELTNWQGGRFDLEMRLKKGECDFGFAEK